MFEFVSGFACLLVVADRIGFMLLDRVGEET